MTPTEFESVTFLCGVWLCIATVWITVLWQNRCRVLGSWVRRVPGVRRIGRGACARRVEALLTELTRRGVPPEGGPDKDQLVDRVHRVISGRSVSVLLQAGPLLVVAFSFILASSPARSTATPLWMVAAFTGFGVVTLALLAADERATTVSDAAGAVTTEAVRFLEALLIPDGRRSDDSALDVHGRLFGRLCKVLRAQARHTPRRMPLAARAQVRETTERLIAALADANQRYLFNDGAERETAVRDLSRLVASALRHSCPPRAQRDSLVIVDSRLLADTPATEDADAAPEPLRSRVLAGAGRVAVAVGLLAGAALFPGGGAATEVLVAAGLASVALVCPPLRDALQRARELVMGGVSAETGAAEPAEEEPDRPAATPTAPCPHCADRSAVTAGSRPVG